MINWGSDGPCSLVDHIYLDKELLELGHKTLSYATAESNDQKLIKKLQSIKKIAKQWERESHVCFSELPHGGSRIPHMFVIENGSFRDTVFTGDDNNDIIIFPEEMSAYHDKDSLLGKALNGNIRKLFTHDFEKNTQYWYSYKPDSISHQKVLYRGQPIFGLTEERFKKEFPEAVFIRSDTVRAKTHYTEPIYRLGKDTLRFSEKRLLQNITAYEKDNWQIDGIAPGDSTKKFESKYPASAPLKIMVSHRFEDLEKKYFYPLELYKGYASFYIEDGRITHLAIAFYVP